MVAPLQGITVVEAANYVAAPSTGALLRDLGAEVIKIEPPGGEPMRSVMTNSPINYLFELENRGKRSVTVALDEPGGPELVHRLLERADVFLTNLIRPRLEKYGLTPEAVQGRNPGVVYVAVTGYGLTGPESSRPAFDFAAFWARSGIMSLIGHPGDPPVLSRIAQGDHTTGINALAGTLAALRLRDLTGQGQVVDVSLQQTGAYTIATDLARALYDGKQPSRMDRTAAPNPLFNTYPTADGQWLMIVHMTPDSYWAPFCRALQLDELLADETLAGMAGRMSRAAELCRMIERRFRSEPFDYWADRLDSHGLIWAPMVELPQVASDAQLRHRRAFPSIHHPDGAIDTVGVPFVIEHGDIGVRGVAPDAGADTMEVLLGAGLSHDEIAGLAARGLLG